jgi:hypothetical protein
MQDTREQAAAARHLSKYIFPRQFGLMHVFDAKEAARTGGAWQYSDWTDREAEIKVSPVFAWSYAVIYTDHLGERCGQDTQTCQACIGAL